MMHNLFQTIYSLDRYPSRVDKLKAIFVYFILSINLVLTVLISIFSILELQGLGFVAATIIMFFIVYGLVRQGQLRVASWILVFSTLLILVLNHSVDGYLGLTTLSISFLLLIIAAFLLETWGIILVTVSVVGQLFIFSSIENILPVTLNQKISLATVYVAIATVLYIYNRVVLESQLSGQDAEVSERLKLADVNRQITAQATARESLDNALNSTLALILDNYTQIYHAQVFLLDKAGVHARLTASTGDAGQRLLSRGHSLAVGGLSVIGQATMTGESVVALAQDSNTVHKINELLPETQLEAAFPLRVGDQIIGALDLQSKELEDLNENDRLTFQSLANSLALAIDNIRQFEQAQAWIAENQRLTEKTRSSMHEIERLNQRLVGRAWSEYVTGIGNNIGYSVDFSNDETQDTVDWTETLVEAIDTQNVVKDGNIIAIPLRIRGQIVGAMEFELDEHQDFTPEDLELITEVGERFGLAAENTRLVEESQRTAQRESLINKMTSRFQSAQNVEATLAEAARSLSDTLGAEKVQIRLGVPTESSNGTGS